MEHFILTRSINDLQVSPEFKSMMEANQFKTLKEVLGKPLEELLILPKSGYRMQRELINLLEANGLENLVGR